MHKLHYKRPKQSIMNQNPRNGNNYSLSTHKRPFEHSSHNWKFLLNKQNKAMAGKMSHTIWWRGVLYPSDPLNWICESPENPFPSGVIQYLTRWDLWPQGVATSCEEASSSSSFRFICAKYNFWFSAICVNGLCVQPNSFAIFGKVKVFPLFVCFSSGYETACWLSIWSEGRVVPSQPPFEAETDVLPTEFA